MQGYRTKTEYMESLGYNSVCYITSRIGWVLLSGVLYRKVSPQERWKISGLDGTHTGAMVLYYGFDEQA